MKSLLCAALLATLALAEDDIGQLVEQHEPTEAASSGEIHHTAFEALADVQYATNGPVQQGFSISRLWFGVTGRIDSTLDYRFFATETRDLSAIQLPFLLPREVSLGIHNLAESGASIRVGLFRPWLNPYWSEMRMEFPGYFGIHSTLLQGEQMGVEGVYPIDSHIEVGVGMNNGNGVFALNTNNSRGFTFFVRRPRRGEDKPIGWGASIYSFRQSAAGASNYRENWVGNLFAI
ncbi:MAG: hypothetical protein HYR96_06215 [Deltaproteobacteria bacterium]|nr:hypothetical protein [Deltaproteobacteria bacterium]